MDSLLKPSSIKSGKKKFNPKYCEKMKTKK